MAILRLLATLTFGITVSTTMTFTPGLPTQSNSTLVANPNTAVANGTASMPLTFTAVDYYGNLSPGVAVTLSASGGNTTLGAISGATNANGVFATTLTSTYAQFEVITASFGAGSSVTTIVQFVPGAASSVTSSLTLSPNTQIANNSNTIVASLTLKDAKGNAIPNVTPTFTASGTSTTVSSAPVTPASGQTSATYQTTVAQNENALVTGGGLSFIAPMAFLAGPPAAAASSLAASPNIAAGNGSAAISLVATARDAQGNAVSGASVALSASGGNNTFTAPNGNTTAGGTYTTTLKSTVMQTETITALIGGSIGETVSVTFTGNANATTSSLAVSPNTQTVGPSNLITATLTLRDAASNALSGVTPTWSASGSTNTIATSGATISSGVSTATYSSTLAQNENVTVTAGGLSFVQPILFTAGALSATTSLTYVRPTRQLANNGNVITAYLLLRDAYNNPLVNQDVTWSASGSNTTVTTNGNTNSGGIASSTYATAIVQNQNALASSGNTFFVQPLIFTSTPTACTLSISPTAAAADGNFSVKLTATVTGGASNSAVMPNVAVSFSSSGGAVIYKPSSIVTDVTGVATTNIGSVFAGPRKFYASTNGVQCTAQGNFLSRTPFCTGNPNYTISAITTSCPARGLAVGDLDSDGNQDIVVYTSCGLLNVYLGTGTGTFALSGSYSTGYSSSYSIVALADFDADGFLDVAVSNNSTNIGSVFLGSKTGQLGAPQPVTFLTRVIALSAADIDGDGAIDLVVGNRNTTSMSVLFGTNSGQFLPPATFASNGTPNVSIGVGDFNSDGLYDVVVPNLNTTNASLLLGTNPGTFASAKAFPVTNSTQTSATVGDLNIDGNLDFIVNGSSNPNVDIYLGAGNGNFQTIKTLPTNGVSQIVTIDDLNGDSIPDIVIPDDTNNAVSVFMGTPSGIPSTSNVYSISKASFNPYQVAVADFNGDGKKDFVMSGFGTSTLLIYIYSGCP